MSLLVYISILIIQCRIGIIMTLKEKTHTLLYLTALSAGILLSACGLPEPPGIFFDKEHDSSDEPRGEKDHFPDLGASFMTYQFGRQQNIALVAVRSKDSTWIELEGVDGFYNIPLALRHSMLEAVAICLDQQGMPEGFLLAGPNINQPRNSAKNGEAVVLQMGFFEHIICGRDADNSNDTSAPMTVISGTLSGDYTTARAFFSTKSTPVDIATGEFSLSVPYTTADLFITGEDTAGNDRILAIRELDTHDRVSELRLDFNTAFYADHHTLKLSKLLELAYNVRISATTEMLSLAHNANWIENLSLFFAELYNSVLSNSTVVMAGDSTGWNADSDYNYSYQYPIVASVDRSVRHPEYYKTQVTLTHRDDPENVRVLRYLTRKPYDITLPFLPNMLDKIHFDDTAGFSIRWQPYHAWGVPTNRNVYRLRYTRPDAFNWHFVFTDSFFSEPDATHHYTFPDLSELPGWDASWAPEAYPDGQKQWRFKVSEPEDGFVASFLLGEPQLLFYDAKRSGAR